MSKFGIPEEQDRAFRAAMAKRLGLDPSEIGDDFRAYFTLDESGGRVTFSGSIQMSGQEVIEMFNAAGRRAADHPDYRQEWRP